MPIVDIKSFYEVLKASDNYISNNWRKGVAIQAHKNPYISAGADNIVDVYSYDFTEFGRFPLPDSVDYLSFDKDPRTTNCDDRTKENCVDVDGIEDVLVGNELDEYHVPSKTYFERIGVNTLSPNASIEAVTTNTFNWSDQIDLYIGDGDTPLVSIDGDNIVSSVDVEINTGPTCIELSADQGYGYIDASHVPRDLGALPAGGNFVTL